MIFFVLGLFLTVPEGAVKPGCTEEIFLAVCRDDKDRPKLRGKKQENRRFCCLFVSEKDAKAIIWHHKVCNLCSRWLPEKVWSNFYWNFMTSQHCFGSFWRQTSKCNETEASHEEKGVIIRWLKGQKERWKLLTYVTNVRDCHLNSPTKPYMSVV